jgi:hypothetical protein
MSIASPAKSFRQWLHSAAATPFGRLVAHFLQKMVRASDLDVGAGGLLGLLAAPGAFAAILMLDKYSAFLNWMRGHLHDDLYVTSIPDKYLFLAVAMAVTGIVTVLKWDQVLPDSQDYLNLAPLPIHSRRILLANAAAICIAVAVVATDVNAVASLLFPLLVTAAARTTLAAFFQFVAAHVVCMVLGSLFSICSVFAILGTAAAVLPRNAFRAVSSWLRGAILLAFLALLLSGFAGRDLLRFVQHHPESPVRFLPSLWFLGLYQVLQDRSTPLLRELARYAAIGLPSVFALTLITYALSYRRRFVAVLESNGRPSRQHLLRIVLMVLDAFAPRRPGFGRAAQRFIVRAMLRSESHRLVLAVALGLGWMAALQDSNGAALSMAYLLIFSLRLAFELPASVPANWVFRVILDPRRTESPAVARRVIYSFLVPCVIVPAFAVACWQEGLGPAAAHTLYLAALSATLAELLLAGYRKLPLTCPLPGFRDNFLMLCLIQFVGYVFFTRAGAVLETWMSLQPWRYALIPAAMYTIWKWNQGRLAEARENGELEEGLTFENAAVTTVQLFDLRDAT